MLSPAVKEREPGEALWGGMEGDAEDTGLLYGEAYWMRMTRENRCRTRFRRSQRRSNLPKKSHDAFNVCTTMFAAQRVSHVTQNLIGLSYVSARITRRQIMLYMLNSTKHCSKTL